MIHKKFYLILSPSVHTVLLPSKAIFLIRLSLFAIMTVHVRLNVMYRIQTAAG